MSKQTDQIIKSAISFINSSSGGNSSTPKTTIATDTKGRGNVSGTRLSTFNDKRTSGLTNAINNAKSSSGAVDTTKLDGNKIGKEINFSLSHLLSEHKKAKEAVYDTAVGKTLSGASATNMGNVGNALLTVADYGVKRLSPKYMDENGNIVEPETIKPISKAKGVTDSFIEQGNQSVSEAKEGQSKLAQVGLDVLRGGYDLASDLVVGNVANGAGMVNMLTRSFGSGAYNEEQAGGSTSKQLLAGAKSAAIEYLTEKMFGMFEGIYGKTVAGESMKEISNQLAKSKAGKVALSALSSFGGEFAEEFMADVFNPIADKILKLEGKENFDLKQALYDGLIGGLLGLTGIGANYRNLTIQQKADIVNNVVDKIEKGEKIADNITDEDLDTIKENIKQEAEQTDEFGKAEQVENAEQTQPTEQPQEWTNPTDELLRRRQNPNDPMNQPTETTQRVRGFSENNATNQDVHPELRDKYQNDPILYETKSNKDTRNKALDIMAEGVESAEAKLQDWINRYKYNNERMPTEAIPLSVMVANELTLQGRKDVGQQILSDMAVVLTDAGQLGQAAIIMRNANPLTVMQTIQKQLDRINESLQARYGAKYDWKAELTQEEIDLIENTDFSKDDGAYEAIVKQIGKRLGAEAKATAIDVYTEVRKLGMLGNARTVLKNAAANVPTIPLRLGETGVSGLVQDVLVKTGVMDEAQQTRTSKHNKESRALAEEIANAKMDELTDNNTKWDVQTIMGQNRQIFKNAQITIGGKTFTIGNFITRGVSNLVDKTGANDIVSTLKEKLYLEGMDASKSDLENLRQAVYGLMTATDAPFVKAAFTDSLSNYFAAHDITTMEDVTQEAIDHAFADAMYYTYKNANFLAETLNKIKSSNAELGTVVDLMMPFTTTPANIMAMLVDHNPLVAGSRAIAEGRAGDFAKMSDDIGKGTMGTLLIALGAILRSMGIISGAEDEDDDKAALDKATGNAPYSIGGRYSYDWAEPVGSFLAMGAEISDVINDNEDVLDAVLNTVYTAGDAVLGMSFFQGITKALRGYGSSTEKIARSLTESAMLQPIPSSVSAISNVLDSKNRVTYDPTANIIENSWTQTKAKTPFVRNNLTEKYNVKGESETRGNFTQRLLNNTINPFNVAYGERNNVDEWIYDFYEENKNSEDNIATSVFPQVAPNKFEVNGETFEMTGEERNTYQKTYSDIYYKAMQEYLDSGVFDNISADGVSEVVASLQKYCRQKAQNSVKKNINDTKDVDSLSNPTMYLALQAKYEYLSKDDSPDYKGLDAYVRSISRLSRKNGDVAEALMDGTRLDELVRVAEKGVTSRQWHDAYNHSFSESGSIAGYNLKPYLDEQVANGKLTNAQADVIWETIYTGSKSRSAYNGKASVKSTEPTRQEKSISNALGLLGITQSESATEQTTSEEAQSIIDRILKYQKG